MSQLVKIILIDSLCAGAKAELAMDGNTSVTGANGIGKSSFMKLVPVFYGAAPGRLVKAGSNRESFANWYLPNASSFIVFEYVNSSAASRCAIMHRSGEGYAYRLVPRSWNPDLLYRDYEAGQLVLPGELHRHLAQQGVECSPELQPMHYRRIIQFNSGSAHLEDVSDPNKRKMIMALRPSFSLAPKRKDFNGIDNVTLALLESGGTFDTMKVTMAEILQQDNTDPSRTLMMLNAQPFKNIVDNRAGYLLMDALKPTIRDLSQTRLELNAVVRQLGIQKRKAQQLEDRLVERRDIRLQAVDELNSEVEALDESSRDKRTELTQAQTVASSQLKVTQQWVTKVEKQRDEYLDHGMTRLLERLDQIPQLLAQRDLKQDHLNQLNRNGFDIRHVYEQRAQLAKDVANDLEKDIHVQSAAVQRSLQSRKDELEARQKTLLDETRTSQRAELEEQQLGQQEVGAQYARLLASVEHLHALKVLPQDQTELDEARQEIEDQRAVVIEHQARILGIEEGGQKLRNEQAELVHSYQGLERRVEELREERETLKAQLDASAETLLGFLRRNYPGWTDNIARLLPVHTLMRTDLNPTLLGGEEKSLYGVELSLHVLPAATIASVDAIESEIAAVSLQIDSLNTELESIQRQKRGLDDRIRQHTNQAAQARNDEKQADIELRSRLSLLAGLQLRASDNHARQLQLQTVLAEETADSLKQRTDHINALKKNHGRHLIDLEAAADQTIADLKIEQTEQQANHDLALKDVKFNLDAELDQNSLDLAARLRDAGIDDRENLRLEAEIQTLDRDIREVSAQRSTIESYRHWLHEILPELPQRISEESVLQAEFDRYDRLISEHDREVNENRKKLSARRIEWVRQGTEDEEQLNVLHQVLKQLYQLDAAETAARNPNLKAADIADEASGLWRQRAEHQRKGNRLYQEIKSRFRVESLLHTPQGAAIEQIVGQANHSAYDTELSWLDAAPSLSEYIEISHPDQKTKLIVQAKNLSDELCDSRAKLEHLHKSIQKLGRDATAKASEVLGSFAQIRQFEFKVTSRIHNMTFWEDLSHYEQQYRRWNLMGDDHLPTENFMEALRNVARQISEGAFSSKLPDCFDVSVSCNDQGRLKIATNNADLVSLSSTGLTKIIVAMIYVSLFELLRQDADFQMSIPIDEALELSAENYVALVNYFNDRGLSMLACFPGGAPELLRQFSNRYTLERNSESGAIIVKEYGVNDSDELDDLNAALAPIEEEFVL